jgi:hypothetical protein
MTARQRSPWLLGAFVLALLYARAASAQSGPFCAGGVTQNCIIQSSITVDGAPKSANITAALAVSNGVYTLQFSNTNNPTNLFELVSAVNGLTTNSVVSLTFRMSNAATDPRLAVSTGLISSWTVNTAPSPHEVTITANPRATSWASPSCTPSSCPNQATIDYQALLLAAFDPISTNGAPADFAYFATKFTSGFTATNGQYLSPVPSYSSSTKGISFFVGSPHLKASSVQNTGFVRMFIPEAVITDPVLWNIPGGSAALAANNQLTTVTVGGLQADFGITAVTAGNTALGALVKIGETNPFGYSVPQVIVQPAEAAPAPTLSQISPTSGTTSGGTAVTLTGTGFNGSSVAIGGVAATSVVVSSATTITATTGAHAAGTVNVVVTNSDTQTATLANGFTYVSPGFTDDPLTAGSTLIKAVHITELRSRIDAIRASRTPALAAFSYTDPSLAAGSTINAVHITELRTALNQAYQATPGRTAPTYTDPTLSAGSTAIKAVHIADLRTAVLAIE